MLCSCVLVLWQQLEAVNMGGSTVSSLVLTLKMDSFKVVVGGEGGAWMT